jgi:hypothetical protein
MKLDIEGCEALAIRGARALLISGRVSILHMEYSPSNIMATSRVAGADMLRELDALGFDAFLSDCSHNIDPGVVQELFLKIAPCHNDQPEALARALVNGVPSTEIPQHIPVDLYELLPLSLGSCTVFLYCGDRAVNRYDRYSSILQGAQCISGGGGCMTNMMFRLADSGTRPNPPPLHQTQPLSCCISPAYV